MSTYLEERINWYDENYRNGNALISDAQFDQLENNLKIFLIKLIKKIWMLINYKKNFSYVSLFTNANQNLYIT